MTLTRQAVAEANLTGFALDDKALRTAMRKFPDAASKAIWVGTRRSMGAFRRDFLKSAAQRVRLGAGGAQGRPSGKITKLARTFFWRVKPTSEGRVLSNTGILGELYTRSAAAHAMEVGATIRPKKKQALAIPIGFARQGWRPGQHISKGKVKRGWRRPAEARRRFAGRWEIFRGRGDKSDVLFARAAGETKSGRRRKAKIYPVFKLVRSIKIKPRLGFFKAWAAFAPQVARRFNDEIGKVLGRLPK